MNAMEGSQIVTVNGMNSLVDDDKDPTDFNHVITTNGHAGKHISKLSTCHSCSVEKHDRQKLLAQKGCMVWIIGLSGSGKSTMACALSRILHQRGKLSYVLDGDNIRHSLNKDLGFEAEDRAENIRRVGEVARLFADAGVICIASLVSPYRRDRDGCRALLPNGDFIEVFMDVPLHICEARDPKGLYKLARSGKIKGEVAKLFADAGVICIASLVSPYRRDQDGCRALLPNGDFIKVFMDVPLHICEAGDPKGLYKLAGSGKIKGFTGIDDPYEAPLNSEIVLKHGEPCASPTEMAEKMVFYLEEKGYLQA